MAQKKGQVLIEKNKDGTGKVDATNMQAKPINQKRGPTTGNAGNTEKRSKFQAAKSETNSEKSALARFVMDALGTRGVGMQGKIDPTVEPLSANRGPKRNPTAGGTEYVTRGRK